MIKVENILVDGGVTSPKGFKAAGIHAGFCTKDDRLDLALVVAQGDDVVAAGAFTQNVFAAAPVHVSRAALANGHPRAVIINSGIANAATGAAGMSVARATQDALSKELDCDVDDVLVASTGVIGATLPAKPFAEGIPVIVNALSDDVEAGHNAARAIMTTDTRVKECAVEFESNGVRYTIGGMAKGSGMIQPNMATMIAVITCDMPMTAKTAQNALLENIRLTFNRVTVDSDTSTNDSVFFLSSGMGGGPVLDVGGGLARRRTHVQAPSYEEMIAAVAETDDSAPERDETENLIPANPYEAFSQALFFVCARLARMIAADGEGASKLVTVSVKGAASEEDADAAARAVANSLLVKTAIAGRDCNWGRVAAALGRSGARFDPGKVDIDIVGLPVMRDGLPSKFNKEYALHYLTVNREIEIDANLHAGNFSSWMWTCDLTHDYITINADYHT